MESRFGTKCRRSSWLLWMTLLVFVLSLATPLCRGAEYPELSSARVAAIAQMLPENPEGTGRPCADRVAWEKVAPLYTGSVRQAAEFLRAPIPAGRRQLH